MVYKNSMEGIFMASYTIQKGDTFDRKNGGSGKAGGKGGRGVGAWKVRKVK